MAPGLRSIALGAAAAFLGTFYFVSPSGHNLLAVEQEITSAHVDGNELVERKIVVDAADQSPVPDQFPSGNKHEACPTSRCREQQRRFRILHGLRVEALEGKCCEISRLSRLQRANLTLESQCLRAPNCREFQAKRRRERIPATLRCAREEHGQACLAWLVHRRADCVVAALDAAAWDGAGSPIDVLAGALFEESPEEAPADPLYWAWDYLTDLAMLHADRLLAAVPAVDRPAVAAILPEWCRPEVSAPGTPASGDR